VVSIWASKRDDVGRTTSASGWPDEFDGSVRTYADGWSNHYPDDAVEKPAAVSLAEIPPWCVPGHREASEGRGADDAEYSENPGPWLRMGLLTQSRRRDDGGPAIPDGSTVVMNPDAARQLGTALLAWADGGHTQPKEQHP
jgi:hypothetical protein